MESTIILDKKLINTSGHEQSYISNAVTKMVFIVGIDGTVTVKLIIDEQLQDAYLEQLASSEGLSRA